MIRLAHPDLSKVFVFEENTLNTLIVENPDLFRRLTEDLILQQETDTGDFVLSENYTPIKMAKRAEIISQFAPFDANRKTLLNKVVSAIEKIAVDEANYGNTQKLLAEIEQYFLEVSLGLPGEISFETISVQSLVKAAGVHLNENNQNPLESILNYMELVRELEGEKLFVFINMRSFFSHRAMDAFVKEALRGKYQIFLLDSSARKRLSNEKRWLIDEDLCEI